MHRAAKYGPLGFPRQPRTHGRRRSPCRRRNRGFTVGCRGGPDGAGTMHGETPWDRAKGNKALKGSDAYWRLNDARFEAPGGGAHRSPTTGPTPTSDKSNVELAAAVPSSGPGCMIAGYPSPPGGVANLGFSWCPASVTLQVRSFALQAAGAQCAIATGSSSTPEQISARRQEIKDGLRPSGSPGRAELPVPPGTPALNRKCGPKTERRDLGLWVCPDSALRIDRRAWKGDSGRVWTRPFGPVTAPAGTGA